MTSVTAGGGSDRARPAVVGVRGLSGSGKTTLVEQLIPRLRAGGLRVGSVKHASHPPQLDRPGKDSHRHAAAGASPVLLLGPGQAALFFHRDAEPELGPWLEQFAGQAELVVVEGFKQTPMPHIEIEVTEAAGLAREERDGYPRWILSRPPGDGGRFDDDLVERLGVEVLAALGLTR